MPLGSPHQERKSSEKQDNGMLVLKLPLSEICSIFPDCSQVPFSLTPTLLWAMGGWPLQMALPGFLCSLRVGLCQWEASAKDQMARRENSGCLFPWFLLYQAGELYSSFSRPHADTQVRAPMRWPQSTSHNSHWGLTSAPSLAPSGQVVLVASHRVHLPSVTFARILANEGAIY